VHFANPLMASRKKCMICHAIFFKLLQIMHNTFLNFFHTSRFIFYTLCKEFNKTKSNLIITRASISKSNTCLLMAEPEGILFVICKISTDGSISLKKNSRNNNIIIQYMRITLLAMPQQECYILLLSCSLLKVIGCPVILPLLCYMFSFGNNYCVHSSSPFFLSKSLWCSTLVQMTSF